MKILITGVGSFIGKNLCKVLIKSNFFIYGTYFTNRPKILSKKLKLVKINLERKHTIPGDFDTIIHCASKVPENGINMKNFNSNLRMTDNIIKTCVDRNCKKIIFLSAMNVYGQTKKSPLAENCNGRNLDLYGKSKIMCEKKLIKFAKESNVKITIFRIPGVTGNNCKNIFIKRLAEQAKINKLIRFNKNCTRFNNIISIKNLCNIIKKSIHKENKSKIYNLGTKYPLKMSNIIKMTYKFFKNSKNYIITDKVQKSNLICLKKVLKAGYKLEYTNKSIYKFLKFYDRKRN